MDQFSAEVIVPIVIALIASIPGILSFIRMLKRDKVEGLALVSGAEKSEADATNVIVTAATALIDPLVEKIERLEKRETTREAMMVDLSKRLTLVERNNMILCDGVRRLILQIQSMGAKPVFEMDESICDEISKNNEVHAGHLT